MKSGMMFERGDLLLVVPFPFTDLSAVKRRPVLAVTAADSYGHFIAISVTSRPQAEHGLPRRLAVRGRPGRFDAPCETSRHTAGGFAEAGSATPRKAIPRRGEIGRAFSRGASACESRRVTTAITRTIDHSGWRSQWDFKTKQTGLSTRPFKTLQHRPVWMKASARLCRRR